MDKIYEFDAVIKKVPDINGAYIEFPYDVRKEFKKGRVAVHVTFDKEPYDGQLVRMQTPCHIVGIRKEIRDKIGKQPGDTVHITLSERIIPAPTFTTVEEYILCYEGEVRTRMETLRKLILSSHPDITEKISWKMPTFVLNGNLVHFSAQKKHLGFHPAPEAIETFADRLTDYPHSKGTIQLPYSMPMPYELLQDIIEYRIMCMTSKSQKI